MMNNNEHSSSLVDPLASYSGLALFPNTFGSLPHPHRRTDSDDPNHIHEYLRSLALKSPTKRLDQAKAVLSGSSEILNSKMTSYAALKNTKDAFAVIKENPRERRPALGRKQARFSMKPNSSQPSVNLEPSIDIDKLKDPEEFFLAYEKLENAKKELQKQMGGVLTDPDQYNLSRTARHRRPGLLGRSSQYKHHQYPSVISDDNEAIISLSPNRGLQREASGTDVASQERELHDTTAKPEDGVNELLDKLLSVSYEDLDGDGLTILQECLEIKPIEIEKLSFEGVTNIFPVNHVKENESSGHGFASSRPQKSPFASMSLLLKSRMSQQLKSLTNPFSLHNLNGASGQVDRRSAQVDTDNSNVSCVELEHNASGNCMDYLIGHAADVQIHTYEQTEVEHHVADIGTGPSGPNVDLEDNIAGNSLDENILTLATAVEIDTNKQSGVEGKAVNMQQATEASAQCDHNIEAIDVEKSIINQDHSSDIAVEDNEAVGCSESLVLCPEQDIEKEPTGGSLDEQREFILSRGKGHKRNKLSRNRRSPNKSREGVSGSCEPEVHDPSRGSMNGTSEAEEAQQSSKQPINAEGTEEVQQSTKESIELQSEAELHQRKGRKRKELSGRQSLAGAGRKWEAGLRRSTRIRTRPLEYWNGERLLYGRIHNSLATVIGMKYVSPGKDGGNPSVKVKSFVTEEYKELLELAALH